jgi:hypothetical protein
MTVEIRPFAPEDLVGFEPGEFDRRMLDAGLRDRLIRDRSGLAASIFVDGKMMGIAGLSRDGATAYPWLVLSDEMRRKHAVTLHRLIKQVIANGYPRVKRAVVAVDPEFTVSRRWVRRLGFKPLDDERFTLNVT